MSLESQRSARLEDPGAEALDRMQTLWERYGRIALGVVIAAAAIGALAFFSLRARAASEDAASGKLAEADLLFWQGDYARSLTVARQVSEQYPSTPSGIDAHRIAGDDHYWMGDFKSAADEYKRYLDKQSTGSLADGVRRSYAYALESSNRSKDAAPLYDGLVGKFDRESSAEFLSAASRCYVASGQKAEAVKRLQRILDEFGETSVANSARVRLAELQASN